MEHVVCFKEAVCCAHMWPHVQIRGKVNALSVDSCQRLGILFDDLVSSCELVNSTRIQVQVTGVVPIIAIDKCDGVQVNLHLASAKQASV